MKKIFLIILLLIFITTGIVYVWSEIYLPIDPNSQEKAVFTIKKGEGAKEISINLKRKRLIKHSSVFRFYVLVKGVSGKLKAGSYSLSKSMNISEMVEKFVSGDVIKKKITIIEGWNLRNIGRYFEEQGVSKEKEFFELVGFPLVDYSQKTDLPKPKDFSKEFEFLRDKPENVGLEGYLFPDTYEISLGETLESIVRKMLRNFDKKLTPELREEIKKQGKTIFEIVTMASLLEKEVQTLEDKKIVSGIFWKRLKNSKPLESCATIAYILGVNKWRYSFKDTRIKSPYNTYLNKGLPLGPICNPGLESIFAAVYPKQTDYWYYLSTPDGKTIFSKTFQEHNIAKSKYLK